MQRELVEKELTSEGPLLEGGGRANRPSTRRRNRSVSVNIAESPLSWMYAHGHLDERLYQAGERLRADYENAQLSPNITMNWDPVKIGGSRSAQDLTPSERQMAARERFEGALRQAGSGLEDILWRVVCAGESIAIAEKALSWPARSGKLVLKLALDRIADFYRIG